MCTNLSLPLSGTCPLHRSQNPALTQREGNNPVYKKGKELRNHQASYVAYLINIQIDFSNTI